HTRTHTHLHIYAAQTCIAAKRKKQKLKNKMKQKEKRERRARIRAVTTARIKKWDKHDMKLERRLYCKLRTCANAKLQSAPLNERVNMLTAYMCQDTSLDM